MRQLNEHIILFLQLMRHLKSLISAQCLAKLVYDQIELHSESRPITTFSSYKGLFHYKRLVQGAKAAFEEYQHEIGQLFINEKHIANMLDDILIRGIDTQHHDENLRRCFQILKENGLTVNLKSAYLEKQKFHSLASRFHQMISNQWMIKLMQL